MKTFNKPISFVIILFTFLFTGCSPAFKGQIESYVTSIQPDILIGTSTLGSEVISFFYNNSNAIKVTDGVESVEIKFDPSAKEIENFEIPLRREKLYLRNFSPAYYSSLGQINNGVIILSYGNLIGKSPVSIFNKKSINENPTAVQIAFIDLYEFIDSHSQLPLPDKLCSTHDASQLYYEIKLSNCYIMCQGKSELLSQLMPAQTRVVQLTSESKTLKNGYRFLWSEEHTTVEIFENGEWYVADPSYGFAYVKDIKGNWLDTQELIEYISQRKYNELVFGLVNDGKIYEIEGDLVLAKYKSISAYYYTVDKHLDYSPSSKYPVLPASK